MSKKASSFDLKKLMNQRSLQMQGQQDDEIEDMEIVMLDVYELEPSGDNFYSTEDIEDLKYKIALMGVLQPLLVKQGDGKYIIRAGHRRRLACMSLVEDGMEKYRQVPCIIKEDMIENEEIEDKKFSTIIDRLTIIAANSFRDKTDWEKMEEALQQEALIEELRTIVKMSGRTRTILKEFTGGKVKEAQAGRYKVIKKNLCPELLEEFKANKINISAAYEAARLSKSCQKEVLEHLKEGGTLTGTDIERIKQREEQKKLIQGQPETQERQQDTETEARSIKEENDKPDDNINISEKPEQKHPNAYDANDNKSEKTEEQKYEEEQNKIDRETKKKLKEQADEEKMKTLPSDKEREKQHIRVAADTFKRVAEGEQSYLIVKGKHKTGDAITLLEFSGGAGTGRTLESIISHMDDETTSTAIMEGYCIINIKQ